jgi:tryptophan 2,3-dioxygenase
MSTDYSRPVLNGEGFDDYARYLRTDVLLSLQRSPEEMVHRDELLFQTVHQVTELLLKHACFEVDGATEALTGSAIAGIDTARRLLERACLGVELATGQLRMLRYLTPWDFQTIRTVLGHGSGFDSPGWREVTRVSHCLADSFDDLVREHGVELTELYRQSPDAPLFQLCESLVDWDERIAIWRTLHYKTAVRMIGHGSVGTQGQPVDGLVKLVSHKFFPRLWALRGDLTAAGPATVVSP